VATPLSAAPILFDDLPQRRAHVLLDLALFGFLHNDPVCAHAQLVDLNVLWPSIFYDLICVPALGLPHAQGQEFPYLRGTADREPAFRQYIHEQVFDNFEICTPLRHAPVEDGLLLV